MKDIIASVVTRYGTNRIHYALMTYDDDAKTTISFMDKITDPSQLTPFINILSKSPGPSNIEKAFIEGKCATA